MLFKSLMGIQEVLNVENRYVTGRGEVEEACPLSTRAGYRPPDGLETRHLRGMHQIE